MHTSGGLYLCGALCDTAEWSLVPYTVVRPSDSGAFRPKTNKHEGSLPHAWEVGKEEGNEKVGRLGRSEGGR